jgi:hypothetical protein
MIRAFVVVERSLKNAVINKCLKDLHHRKGRRELKSLKFINSLVTFSWKLVIFLPQRNLRTAQVLSSINVLTRFDVV